MAGRRVLRRTAGVLVGVLASVLPAPAWAQSASAPEVGYSSAYVPVGHWSIAAVRRLAALGLTPRGFDGSRRAFTQAEVAAALAHADSTWVASDGDRIDALAGGFRHRFAHELGIAADEPRVHRFLGGSAATAGFELAEGRIETGWGYWFGYPNGVDWNEPEPLDDVADPLGLLEVQVNAGALSGRSAFGYAEGKAVLAEGYVALGFKGVQAWAGRRQFGYGPGQSGGIVLTGVRADGGGIQSARPFDLPWILHHLGPATIDVSLTSIDLQHSFDNVLLLVNRGTIEPHRRFRLGVTRAAMFGGEGNGELDWFDVFSVLVGKHAGDVASELENQIVSLDAVWRIPVERWLPLRTYVEWGFEDSAGAWTNVPGVLFGVEVPAVPGVPGLGLAVEAVHFDRSCCGNPIWYRHSSFHDGWSVDGRPLGHPLGGHGREIGMTGTYDFREGRARAGGRMAFRDRGEETPYAPDRIGRSVLVEAGVQARIFSGLEVRVGGRSEVGEDWHETGMDLTFRASLQGT